MDMRRTTNPGAAGDPRRQAHPSTRRRRGWRHGVLLLAAGLALGLAPAGAARAASSGCATSNGQVTCTYSYTGGEQTFTVPAGVTALSVTAVGGRGANGYNGYNPAGVGGVGGVVTATIPVAPAEVLYVEVGGNGGNTFYRGSFNGGGAAGGGGGGGAGGGASDVRTCSSSATSCATADNSLDSRLLVAAGGGGAGGFTYGGAGGPASQPGSVGGTLHCGFTPGSPGGAGTQMGGGSGGAAGSGPGAYPGQDGAPGSGGATNPNSVVGGGGGGGGYYGGGGGGGAVSCAGGGGGGGSNLVPAGGTSGLDSTGVPAVTISYQDTSSPSTTASFAGTTGNAPWYASPVEVSLHAIDPDDAYAGPLTTYYSIDQSSCAPASLASCQTYTGGPISIGDGQHTLYYFSVDQAGNAEAQQQRAVDVDSQAPSAPNASFSATPVYTDGSGNQWYRDSVTVSYGGSTDPSPGSGVDPAMYTAPQTFDSTGSFSYSGTVQDMAGNLSPATTGTVYVDATPPTVSFTSCPTSVQYGSAASAIWTASDQGSGLAGASSGSLTLDTGSVGQHTVAAPTATDNVGHTSDTATCAYSVQPAPLAITANDKSMTYGGSVPGFDASYNGFINGDTSNVVSGLTCGAADGNGNPVSSGTPAGSYAITCSGGSAANYSLSYVGGMLTINQAPQAISFGPLANHLLGDAPVTVSATGGASGNPVTFTAGPSSVCTSSGTNGASITLVGVGTCIVTANQAGNGSYLAAPSVARSFNVSYPPLSLALGVSSSPAGPITTGSTVTATMILGNHTTTAQTVTLKATLTYTGSGGSYSLTVPLKATLSAGQTLSERARFTISKLFPRGTYSLQVTATDTSGDNASSSATLTVS